MRTFLQRSSLTRTNITSYGVVALFVLFGALLLIPSSDSLSGSPSTHLPGEILAATIGAVAGVTLLFTAASTGRRWLSVPGIALLAAAGFDIAHGVAAEPLGHTHIASTSLLFAGRLVLVVGLFRALTALDTVKPLGARQSTERLLPAALAAGLLLVAAAVSPVWVSTPSDSGLGMALFSITGVISVAALFVMRNRESGLSYVRISIIVALFVNVAADGAFMAHSTVAFDAGAALFHLLKIVSYTVLLSGVLADSVRLYGQERAASSDLVSTNRSLNSINSELNDLANDLQVLNEIGRIAGSSGNVADRFQEIGAAIASRMRTDRIAVVTIGARPGMAMIEAVYGQSMPDRGPGDFVPVEGTVTGDAIKEKKTLIFTEDDIHDMARTRKRNTADLQAGFKSWMSTQVIADDKVVGSLLVRSKQPNAYGEREARFIEQVASQLAGPILQSQLANSKNLFYSSISHELKTPISATRGYTGLLRITGADNLSEEQISFLDAIDRNGVQLTMLIDDLLDIGTISDQRVSINPEPVEVNAVLDECVADLQILARAKGQEIETRFETRGAVLNADRRRLVQLVTNLGSNASKYSPEGSVIAVSTSVDGNSLKIAVTDRGFGISEEDQQRYQTLGL